MTRTTFVTRTSAARVTFVPAAAIVRVECWASVVLVVFVRGLGLRPRFVSYRAFEADAIAFRAVGASKLPGTVTDLGSDIYTVQGSKGDTYTVDFAVESCSCPDSTHRGVRCKHVIKCAGYIESRRAAVALAETRKQQQIFRAAIDEAVANVGRGNIGRPEYTESEKLVFASCGW